MTIIMILKEIVLPGNAKKGDWILMIPSNDDWNE